MIVLVVPEVVETNDNLEEKYNAYLADTYEGMMVRLDEPYESKRSNSLMKYKQFFDGEFEIVSINEGNGNWKNKAKSVTCIAENGELFDAGIKGTAAEMTLLWLRRDEMVGKFATIRYQNLTPDRQVPRIGIAHIIHETERW